MLQEKRHKEFLSMKRKVVALCNEMDYQPESSFEKDIMSDEDDCFQLTTDNMDSLKTALQDVRNLSAYCSDQLNFIVGTDCDNDW